MSKNFSRDILKIFIVFIDAETFHSQLTGLEPSGIFFVVWERLQNVGLNLCHILKQWGSVSDNLAEA